MGDYRPPPSAERTATRPPSAVSQNTHIYQTEQQHRRAKRSESARSTTSMPFQRTQGVAATHLFPLIAAHINCGTTPLNWQRENRMCRKRTGSIAKRKIDNNGRSARGSTHLTERRHFFSWPGLTQYLKAFPTTETPRAGLYHMQPPQHAESKQSCRADGFQTTTRRSASLQHQTPHNDVPWSGGSDDIPRASVAQFCTILLRMVDPTVVAVTSAASRRRTCLWVRKDQMTVRFTAGDLKKRQKKALKPPFLGVRAGCCRKRKGGGEE
jgi:hypothetical protein